MKVPASPLRRLIWPALVVALTCVGLLLAERTLVTPISNATDFRAFYCAGKIVDAGADSYRVEPMRSCQEGVLASQRLGWFKGLVVPAPLPPYSLVFFGVLARLPYLLAASLWCAVTIVCWLRTARVLAQLTALPLRQIVVATFALGLLVSISYGQLVPFELWLLVECAALLRARNGRAAAIFATVALIEPQVGGPAFLALLLARRDLRGALSIGFGVLAAVSLAFVGPAHCLEWFTGVLPAHETSELRNPEQLGLTTALSLAGASAGLARLGGSLEYAAMVALALWAAPRVARRWSEPAALVFVPVAFALFGGPYVHEHQLSVAIPLALLGYARTRGAAFGVAIGLLAIPWVTFAESFPQLHDVFWPWHPIALGNVPPNALADVMWQQFMAYIQPSPRAILIASLVKLPLWTGLALTIVASVREARRERVSPVANYVPVRSAQPS